MPARVVAAGDALLAPSVTRRLISEFAKLQPAASQSPAAVASLTPRETQVLRLMAEGLSNPEIGTRLFISARTVQYHLSKVFTTLGISSRNQLHQALPPNPDSALAG